MKIFRAIGTVLALAVASPSTAEITGNVLVQLCRTRENDTACTAYIAGSWNGISATSYYIFNMKQEFKDEFGSAVNFRNALLEICPDNSVSLLQVTEVVRKYLIDHPENLHIDGSVIVFLAMRSAFPCPSR